MTTEELIMDNAQNVTAVDDKDKNFIKELLPLPPEKKALMQGIMIGLDIKQKEKVG